MHRFEIYQGSAARDTPSAEFGPIGDMVLRLTDDIRGKYHKLFLDNLFTTVQLLAKLKDEQILATGTLRGNRLKGRIRLS